MERHKITKMEDWSKIEEGLIVNYYDFVTFDNCPKCNGAVYLTHNPFDMLVFTCDACEADFPIDESTMSKKPLKEL